MRYRTLLLAAASAASLASFSTAFAQDVAAAADVDAIVVTGTRAARSRLETLAPVDVIDNKSLARQGNGVELAQAMANLTPAINFPRPAFCPGQAICGATWRHASARRTCWCRGGACMSMTPRRASERRQRTWPIAGPWA